MAAETAATRIKTRRVKDHILNRFLALADKVDAGEALESHDGVLYRELLLTFAKNVIPRSQEVTGEDGEAIKVAFDPAFNGTTQQTTTDSGESGSVQDSKSGA